MTYKQPKDNSAFIRLHFRRAFSHYRAMLYIFCNTSLIPLKYFLKTKQKGILSLLKKNRNNAVFCSSFIRNNQKQFIDCNLNLT